jgi:hypothetical protein
MAKNRHSRAKSKTAAIVNVAAEQPTATVAAIAPEAPVTMVAVEESIAIPADLKPAARQPTHDEIARRAYELWLRRGAPMGTHLDDWLSAERELTAA